MISAFNKFGTMQKNVDPHTIKTDVDGRIISSDGPALWVDPALLAKARQYPPITPPAKPTEPLAPGTADYTQQSTPTATAVPVPKPPKPDPHVQTARADYVPAPAPDYTPHEWPEVRGTPGQVVKLSGVTVGYVGMDGVVKITEPSPAGEMIRAELLTRLDAKGELKGA